jgi:hypothetical protein
MRGTHHIREAAISISRIRTRTWPVRAVASGTTPTCERAVDRQGMDQVAEIMGLDLAQMRLEDLVPPRRIAT